MQPVHNTLSSPRVNAASTENGVDVPTIPIAPPASPQQDALAGVVDRLRETAAPGGQALPADLSALPADQVALAAAVAAELLDAAAELANSPDVPKTMPAYRAGFALARRLRGILPDDPILCMDAVKHFCKLQERHFFRFSSGYFVPAWSKIRFVAGEVDLAAVLVDARADPYPCVAQHDDHRWFITFCYRLSLHSDDGSFFMARKRLFKLAGWDSNQITWYLRSAVDAGLITCIDDTYTYRPGKGGRAKSQVFRFIGPDPAAPESEPGAATIPKRVASLTEDMGDYSRA